MTFRSRRRAVREPAQRGRARGTRLIAVAFVGAVLTGVIGTSAAGAEEDGKAVFGQLCQGCHTIGGGKSVGRKALIARSSVGSLADLRNASIAAIVPPGGSPTGTSAGGAGGSSPGGTSGAAPLDAEKRHAGLSARHAAPLHGGCCEKVARARRSRGNVERFSGTAFATEVRAPAPQAGIGVAVCRQSLSRL